MSNPAHASDWDSGEPVEPPRRISVRQLEANRRNAQRSTGPRTAAGKAAVSRNALKHGAYADIRPIRTGEFREDPLEIAEIVDGVLDTLKPRTTMERDAALRIARLHVQMNRHFAFETVEIELNTTGKDSYFYGSAVFDAQANSVLFMQVSEILTEDPATYTNEEWHVLLLAGAMDDPDLREIYTLLDMEDDRDLADSAKMILSSLGIVTDGDRERTAALFAQWADAEAEALPDPHYEARLSRTGVSSMTKNGVLDSHTRIQARISAALDRELKRYQALRAMTPDAPGDDDSTGKPAPHRLTTGSDSPDDA